MAKRTSKKSQSKSSQPADAVQMLKADHKQVRKFFEQFYDAPDNDKGSIAGKLFIELDIHSKLEEELFYPAVQSQLVESFGRGNGLDVTDDGEGGTVEDAELTFDPIDGAELEAIDDDDDASEVISTAYESHRDHSAYSGCECSYTHSLWDVCILCGKPDAVRGGAPVHRSGAGRQSRLRHHE